MTETKPAARSPIDWSSRHARLRIELAISSLILFLLTHYEINTNKQSIFPLDLQGIPAEHLVFFFCGLTLYLAFHLVVRTINEAPSIQDHLVEVSVLVQSMESSSGYMSKLHRSFVDLDDQLQENALPPLDQLKSEINELVLNEISKITNQTHRPNSDLTEPGAMMLNRHLEVFISELDNMTERWEKLFGRSGEFTNAIEQARNTAYFLTEVDQTSFSLKRYGIWYRFERLLFSFWLPMGFALVVFALSLPGTLDALPVVFEDVENNFKTIWDTSAASPDPSSGHQVPFAQPEA